MSIFRPVRKAAKFTFVTAPLSIFGWELNKRLFGVLRGYWSHSINPACPACDNGVLTAQRDAEPVLEPVEGDKPRQLYPWTCDHCDFAMLEGLQPKRVREVVARYRAERARAMYTELEWRERADFAKSHRVASRIFFVVALLLFANSVRMLASGVSPVLSLNWTAFAFMFWVFGMKRSYRSWQVMSGHIFEQGAARHWFKHEKWLI